jgi:Tfp pilus assembly protein PilX
VLERELRRAMEAAQQKPAEPAAPPAAAVAVVESEKKVQRERTKEKPAIKGTDHTTSSVLVCRVVSCRVCGDGLFSFDSCGAAHTRVCVDGTHSTVVSETLEGTKFRVKQAQLEDRCSKCSQLIADETMIQVDSGAKYLPLSRHRGIFCC